MKGSVRNLSEDVLITLSGSDHNVTFVLREVCKRRLTASRLAASAAAASLKLGIHSLVIGSLCRSKSNK